MNSIPDRAQADTDNPKLCECGCGKPTRLARYSNRFIGYVQGQPLRFIQGHRVIQSIEERFWENVDKSGECWVWTGSTSNRYGEIRLRGERYKTHRLSWELHFGPIPDGLLVCHHCDNPPCVRPDHLFLGTNSDNQLDASRKGRHVNSVRLNPSLAVRGEAHPHSRLTEEQVRYIYGLRNGPRGTITRLQRELGITPQTIYGIMKGKAWRHVTQAE